MKKKPDDLIKRNTPKRPMPASLRRAKPIATEIGDVIGENKRFILGDSDRACHAHIIGSTGSGKSKLIEYMIRQQVQNSKQGLCLVDPHGQLYGELVHYISHHNPRLAERVVLFNPAGDLDQVLGFNPIPSDVDDVQATANQLTSSVLKALGQDSQAHTPRITRWLKNIFVPLIVNKLTLLEAIPFLYAHETARRQDILKTVMTETVISDWIDFDKLPPKDRINTIEGAANRLIHFVENKRIRHIVGQAAHALDLKQIMDEGKILLVNLNGGIHIPHESSHLLGVFLMNEIVRNAKLRSPESPSTIPFHVYVDEFALFVTRDIARALEECRKNKCFFTLAHQHLTQLKNEDDYLYSSVLTNCKLRYVFGGLSTEDSDIMSKEIFTGFLDLKEKKDSIISTKAQQIEETRTVTSQSFTDTISKGTGLGTGVSEARGENSGTSEGISYGTAQSFSKGTTTSHMEGRSETDSTNVSETKTQTTGETKGEGSSTGQSISHGTSYQRTEGESHSETSNWSETDTTNFSHSVGHSNGQNRGRSQTCPNQGDGGSKGKSKGKFSGRTETFTQGGSHSEMHGGSVTDGNSSSESWGTNEMRGNSVSQSISSSEHKSKSEAAQSGHGHSVSHNIAETTANSSSESESQNSSVQTGKSFGTSIQRTQQRNQTWSQSTSFGKNIGQSKVPFLKPVPYQEETGRTFWSIEEQLYRKAAELKNQETGTAFIKMGTNRPVQVEIDYVATPYRLRSSPNKINRFIQAVFKAHQEYYSPHSEIYDEFERRHRSLFGSPIRFDEIKVLEAEEVIMLPEKEEEDPFNS